MSLVKKILHLRRLGPSRNSVSRAPPLTVPSFSETGYQSLVIDTERGGLPESSKIGGWSQRGKRLPSFLQSNPEASLYWVADQGTASLEPLLFPHLKRMGGGPLPTVTRQESHSGGRENGRASPTPHQVQPSGKQALHLA